MEHKAGEECQTLAVAHLLGKRWCIPVLEEIRLSGSAKFSSMKKSLPGITAKNLSTVLSDLCESRMVEKKQVSFGSSLVEEYTLGSMGEAVCKVVEGMKALGIEWYGTNQYCKNTKCSGCRLFRQEHEAMLRRY
jgi:DNA-binding HxlR family transcriptional regulator